MAKDLSPDRSAPSPLGFAQPRHERKKRRNRLLIRLLLGLEGFELPFEISRSFPRCVGPCTGTSALA
jgi:hypothetical protein